MVLWSVVYRSFCLRSLIKRSITDCLCQGVNSEVGCCLEVYLLDCTCTYVECQGINSLVTGCLQVGLLDHPGLEVDDLLEDELLERARRQVIDLDLSP